MKLKVQKTRDGSDTLYDPALDETYHSHHGALTESEHVFIKNGLSRWFQTSRASEVKILEIGFGTGLNAVLSCLWAVKNRKTVFYHTLDPFALNDDIVKSLNYFEKEPQSRALFQSIHKSLWNDECPVNDWFILHKYRIALEDFDSEEQFDVVYFDAFAPDKQPEIWHIDNLRKAHDLLSAGGILTTYCAKGEFKRNLKNLSFKVEAVPGPPGGKMEMVRAVKPTM